MVHKKDTIQHLVVSHGKIQCENSQLFVILELNIVIVAVHTGSETNIRLKCHT